MSDAHRRARERDAHGDLVAASAGLRDALRAGTLDSDELQLLAIAGDAAARLAAPESPPAPAVDAPIEAWVGVLAGFGKGWVVRAAIDATRPLLSVLEEHAPWEPRPRAALDAAAAWVRTRREAERVGARLAQEEADAAVEQLIQDEQPTLSDVELAWIATAAAHAARLAAAPDQLDWTPLARQTLRAAEDVYADLGDVRGAAPRICAGLRAAVLASQQLPDPPAGGVA